MHTHPPTHTHTSIQSHINLFISSPGLLSFSPDPPAQSPSPLHALDDALTLRPVAGHPAYPDKIIPSAAEASALEYF